MELQPIQSKIYEIRGQRVMLDFDLAELYGVTTGNLNKAVKRNIERFPERFMFQLTQSEALRFQNGTLNETTGTKLQVKPSEANISNICLMPLPNKAYLCCRQYCVVPPPCRSAYRLWTHSWRCGTTSPRRRR